jgi:hypothetical protein
LFKAIIAAAISDENAAAALAGFYDTRIAELAPVIADAITRGEAPVDTDPVAVIRQVSAPLYYQFLTSTDCLTTKDAQRAVAVTLAAVAAGAITR